MKQVINLNNRYHICIELLNFATKCIHNNAPCVSVPYESNYRIVFRFTRVRVPYKGQVLSNTVHSNSITVILNENFNNLLWINQQGNLWD